MDNSMDTSFDGQTCDFSDLPAIAGAADGPRVAPVPKKLIDSFEDAAKIESCLKVFLRVRPSSHSNNESTVRVVSETEIVTVAPEASKRAQYTRTEERQYVSADLP
jgi:hypothetical protein